MQNTWQFQEKRFKYGFFFRVMHWAVAASFLITITLILSSNFIEEPAIYKQVVNLHRSYGMLVLLLVLIRLTWRLFSRDYPYTGNSPILQFVASVSHAALYLMMLSTPFLGWMEASARHKPITIFGMDLPMLLERNVELAEQLQEWHRHLAVIFIAVVSIHITSAVWHHFFRRDGVLYSMIPIRALRKPWVDRMERASNPAYAPNKTKPD
jgi:cytochrome b561